MEGDLIFTKMSCPSKDELIKKLFDRINDAGRLPPFPPSEILNKIQIREEIGGTLLPSGLSVPHARLKEYEGFVLALGTPAESVFHNGIQIRLVALMISNQSGGVYYLPALAALTKLSRDTEYFSRLGGAETPAEFFNILKERDTELI